MNTFVIYAWPFSLVITAVLSYYVGHRSPTGVKSDLADIKEHIDNLEAKIKSKKTVVVADVKKVA